MGGSSFIESLERRALLSATGTRDLLYVRVQFADQSAAPESASKATSVANGAARLVTNYSGGQLEFRVKTTWVGLRHSSGHYKSTGTAKLAADADAALRSAGYRLSSYEHVSYRYHGSVGSFAGIGLFNGSRTWIKVGASTVLAHELGHNLGLGHAAFANPKDNAKPFGSSTASEYGDVFTNMGSGGSKDWHAHNKWALGWISGAKGQVKSLSDVSLGTHTYTLASHDNASSYATGSVYLVRLVLDSTTAYYVSYRNDADGIMIHRDRASGPRAGSLIDAKPGTSTASDAKLAFGQTLTDRRGAGAADDIRFSVTRIGSTAQLKITLGAVTTT